MGKRKKDHSQKVITMNLSENEIARGHFQKMTLRGVITKGYFKGSKKIGRYSLTCKNGERYQFFTNKEWEEVLEKLCWIDVKVKGVVEMKSNTLIPSAIVPYFPTENRVPIEATFRERASKVFEKIKNFESSLFQREVALA